MRYHKAVVIVAFLCSFRLLACGVSAGRLIDLRHYSKRSSWAIGIYWGQSPLHLYPAVKSNPVLTADKVTDVRARFVADPFMIKVKSTWYMFFEVMNDRTRQGDIGLATSNDGLVWSYKQIVLDEPFHLSYPYIFEHANQFYMIPETHDANSVRLYKATRFPTRWAFVKTLLVGNYVDPSVILHDGKWWMFAGGKLGRKRALRVYYADDLMGNWTEHPKSPIAVGNGHIARPGGRVMNLHGRIIRFAQDDDPAYGLQVRAIEVTELTPTSYKERELTDKPVLKGAGRGWNAGRMHHCDPHELSDSSWIACVDGCR